MNKQSKKIYTDAQTQTEERTEKQIEKIYILCTPEELVSAINNKNYTKVRHMVEQGIDLNIQDKKTGDTPLILAIKTEDKKMVKILLDAKADPNENNIDDESPLDYSLDLTDDVITELLFEYKADINVEEGIPYIWHVVDKGKDINKLQLLLKHGAHIDDMWDDRTPLMCCIENIQYNHLTYGNNLAIIRCLLENGANVDEQDSQGNTALHYALDINDNNVDEMEIIKMLLQYGADVTIENNKGDTPMYKALHSNMKAWHLFDYTTNWKKL